MIGVYILSGTITPVKLINMSPKLPMCVKKAS